MRAESIVITFNARHLLQALQLHHRKVVDIADIYRKKSSERPLRALAADHLGYSLPPAATLVQRSRAVLRLAQLKRVCGRAVIGATNEATANVIAVTKAQAGSVRLMGGAPLQELAADMGVSHVATTSISDLGGILSSAADAAATGTAPHLTVVEVDDVDRALRQISAKDTTSTAESAAAAAVPASAASATPAAPAAAATPPASAAAAASSDTAAPPKPTVTSRPGKRRAKSTASSSDAEPATASTGEPQSTIQAEPPTSSAGAAQDAMMSSTLSGGTEQSLTQSRSGRRVRRINYSELDAGDYANGDEDQTLPAAKKRTSGAEAAAAAKPGAKRAKRGGKSQAAVPSTESSTVEPTMGGGGQPADVHPEPRQAKINAHKAAPAAPLDAIDAVRGAITGVLLAAAKLAERQAPGTLLLMVGTGMFENGS